MKRVLRYTTLAGIAFVGVVIIGCATARLDVPAHILDTVEYEDGCPVLKSEKTNIVHLSFSPISFKREQNASILILVKNNSAKPFNMSPANVAATLDEKPLRVFTYEELRENIETDAAWSNFAVVLSGMTASMAAAQPRTTRAFGSTSSYGSFNAYGNSNLSGDYNSFGTHRGFSSTNDPAATAQAQAAINTNAAQQLAGITENRNVRLSGLESLLRITTVHPGEVKAGVVQIKAPMASSQPKDLCITVSTPDDEHIFHLNYKSK